jgi:hypothetical protein
MIILWPPAATRRTQLAGDVSGGQGVAVYTADAAAATIPSAEFLARIERIGGEALYDLFALTVTAPIAQTWYLAKTDLDANALYSGSPAYQGIVLSAEGAQADAGIGGSTAGGFTFEVLDAIGTYPGQPGKRWSDQFVELVVGYQEPYDLQGATLTVSIAIVGLSSVDILPIGFYRVDPASVRRQTGRLTIGCEPDLALIRRLPTRKITRALYSTATPAVLGRSIPIPFGRAILMPGIPVDPLQGRFLLCESPAATPINAIASTYIVIQDETTKTDTLAEITSPSSNPVVSHMTPGTLAWRTLEVDRAQMLFFGTGYLVTSLLVRLRPKSGDPAPAGGVQVSIERPSVAINNLERWPSGQPVEAAASGILPASNVTTDQYYTFAMGSPLPFAPPGQWWLTVRYSKATGAGNIEIAMDDDGDGDWFAAETTDEGSSTWFPSQDMVTTTPEGGLSGDAWIAKDAVNNPPLVVVDSQTDETGEPGLVVGRWSQFHGPIASARAIIRLPISTIDTANATLVVLAIYLSSIHGTIPDMILEEIVDLGAITTAYYNATVRTVISTAFITSANVPGYVQSDNLITLFQAAKARGASHVVLRLRATDETSTPSPTGEAFVYLRAGDSITPSLWQVVYGSGRDLLHQVNALQFTPESSVDDGSGNAVARVTFGQSIGERRLVASIDGIRDDVDGTYTGTPNALIEHGPDLVHWLARAPIASNAAVARLDLAAFITARARLAALNWPVLAGVIFSEEDGWLWLARIARSMAGLVYLDQHGRLAVWVDGRGETIRRHVYPWEHGPLTAESLGAAAGGGSIGLPWTRVEVYAGRDLLNLENAAESRSEVAEWNDYAVLASDQTDPADATRQAQAVTLTARYGVRANGGPGPTEENTAYFLPEPTASQNPTAAQVLRDWLWDRNAQRPAPFDVVSVELPRYALGWRLMDEVTLESWEFPSAGGRALIGLSWTAPWNDQGREVEWYQARRGRFSVRTPALRANAGDQWPASVVLKLVAWETT